MKRRIEKEKFSYHLGPGIEPLGTWIVAKEKLVRTEYPGIMD